jgi:hypothetical protein
MTKTSVVVEDDLETALRAEAKAMGVGWTTALKLLAREALAARKARA